MATFYPRPQESDPGAVLQFRRNLGWHAGWTVDNAAPSLKSGWPDVLVRAFQRRLDLVGIEDGTAVLRAKRLVRVEGADGVSGGE